MEVLGASAALVVQPEAALAEPPAEIEVLVVVDELLVEAAGVEEERPLQREVARVEPTPAGVVAIDVAVVELGAGPVEPAGDAIVPDVGMPVDVTEHAALGRGVALVAGQVALDELRHGDHV